MKQRGTRYGFLILFLFLVFTLLCSLNAMAQADPSYAAPSVLNNGTAGPLPLFYSDPLTYTLNNNLPNGELFFNTTANGTSSGQWYRGEGASLINPVTGIGSDPVYTNSTLCTSLEANNYKSTAPLCSGTPTSGCYMPALTSVQIGGSTTQSMYCCGDYTATVNANGTSWSLTGYGYCSAGNWSNLEAYLLDENVNYNPAYVNTAGSPGPTGQIEGTGVDYGTAQQCMGCHGHMNVQASDGPAYLLSGHKNALRKVIPGVTLAGPDGTPYSGLSGAYYVLGGWVDPTAPEIFSQAPGYGALSLGACARCHTTGWSPNPPNTATGTSGLGGYGSQLATQSGLEPSIAAINNGTVAFNGTLLYSTTVNGTTTYSGYQNSPGVPTYTYTALPSGTLNTSPYSTFGPPGAVSASWYLNGVTCERCHYSDIGITGTAPTGAHRYGKDTASQGVATIAATNPSGYSDAPMATGMNSLLLCMQCHRSETVTSTGANTANVAINWPIIVASDSGSCADGSGANYNTCTTTNHSTWNFAPTIHEQQGTEMLASPHAKYMGSAPQMNQQNSADLSFANGTINIATNFATVNVSTSLPGTKGCTGCHDPHFTTVNVPNVNTNPSWGILYSDGAMTKVNAPSGPQAEMPALVSSGANSHNCNDAACHGNSMQSLAHSTGPGTPFPTGTSADFPGACFTCHMQGSSGVAQSHFFRVNPSATYYTYPTAAQFYTNGTTPLSPDPTAFVLYNGVTLANGTYSYLNGTVTSYGVPSPAMINGTATTAYLATGYAVANDVDIVCGQCHGGGGPTDSRGDTNAPSTNPYGIATTGAPYFQRPYLASIAASIHGTTVGSTLPAPTFTPPAGSYTTTQSVTLADATTTATICYTTNGNTPTASAAGVCDTTLPDNQPNGELGVPSGTSISVAGSETVMAIATQVGNLNSSVAAATYIIGPTAAVAAPTFSVSPGTYTLKTSTSTLSVKLSDATSGATICYTVTAGTTGTAPTAASGGCTAPALTYSAPISISATSVVEAIGTISTGAPNSSVVIATYTLIPAAPTFSPAAETFYQSFNTGLFPDVTLTSNTGAAITYCYVAAGSMPCTPTTAYSGALTVGCTAGSPPCDTLIYAEAVFPGGTAVSSVSHAKYAIKPGDPPGTPTAATPTFSPLPGVITATESVAIADASSAPMICYTLNGPAPVVNPTATSTSTGTAACTVGTPYAGVAIPLNAVEGQIYTIRSAAGGTGFLHSAIAKGEYIFR
jgi:hypothetical protein